MTLRKKIDDIDEKLVLLLEDRMDLCKCIGDLKRRNKLSIKDRLREDEVYLHIMAKALESGLNPQKVEEIFKDIIALAIFIQGAE